LKRLDDLGEALRCVSDLELGQLLEEAIEVVEHLWRELDTGHATGQRPSLRATGLRGRSPRDRASRYALAASTVPSSPSP